MLALGGVLQIIARRRSKQLSIPMPKMWMTEQWGGEARMGITGTSEPVPAGQGIP